MSIVSGIMNANATKSAANTAKDSANYATDVAKGNFDLIQAQEAPYRNFGTANLGELQKMLSGGYNMQESPSAQYALMQGTKAINSSLGARGLEGNATQQLGQMASSTAASDYSNRFQQLLSAVNIGTSATAMTASGANSLNSSMSNAAGQIGSAAMWAGNQNASTIGGAAGNMAGIGAKLLGNYMSSPSSSSSSPSYTMGDTSPAYTE